MRKFFISLALLVCFASGASGAVLMADNVKGETVLTPYLSWTPDPDAALSIEEASSPEMAGNYAPLNEIMPVTARGPVWLRLVMAKTPPPAGGSLPFTDSGNLMLSMDMLPPGDAVIYIPDADSPTGKTGWKKFELVRYSEFELPDPGYTPISVYIRLEETPGMWFDPKIIPHKLMIPEMLPFELLLPGLLLLGVLACLLRATISRAAWALWASLYLCCGLAQCLLPLPSFRGGLALSELPAILAPGLALLLLPQIGRIMTSSKEALSGFMNGVLILFSLIGAILCLAPLLPGLDWLTRLYPIWPLVLLPLLPVCFALMGSGRPGSISFTWAVLLPVIGAGVALFAVTLAEPHPLMHNAALFGMAVGGLGLFFSRAKKIQAVEQNDSSTPPPAGDLDATLALAVSAAEQTKNQGKDLDAHEENDEPGLKIIAREIKDEKPEEVALPFFSAQIEGDKVPAETPTDFIPEAQAESEKEQSVPESPEAPLHESLPETTEEKDIFDKPAEPVNTVAYESPKVFTISGDHLEPVTEFAPNAFPDREEPVAEADEESDTPAPEAGGELENTAPAEPQQDEPFITDEPAPLPETPATVLEPAPDAVPDVAGLSADVIPVARESKVITLTDDENLPWPPYDFSEELSEGDIHGTSLLLADASFVFDLGSLVRDVHESIAPLAKQRGLVYSWYVAPDLPVLLEGDAPNLRQALTLLLQNAVQATEKGTVQLAVRNATTTGMPAEKCRVLFTITDSGTAKRSDAGFFHAWQLTSRTGGSFDASYSPEAGTKITFIVVLDLPSENLIRLHLERVAAQTDPALRKAEEKNDSVREAYLKGEIGAEELEKKALEAGISLKKDAVVNKANPLHDPEIARFLVADTTTSNRRLLVNYLSGLSHEHIEAPSIREIPALLRKQPVSLVIFDADMPESEITQAITEIRQFEQENSFSGLPILVLTSHEIQSDRMLKAGATRTLAKPFDKRGLETVVNECLGKEPAYYPESPTPETTETVPVEEEVKLDPAIAALLSPPASRITATETAPQIPVQERDTDLLAEALRDAPQGMERKSISVELPPVNLVVEEAKAAPVVLSLSAEDVSPHVRVPEEEKPELTLEIEGREKTDGDLAKEQNDEDTGLLEFMILDEEKTKEAVPQKEEPKDPVYEEKKAEKPKPRVTATVTVGKAVFVNPASKNTKEPEATDPTPEAPLDTKPVDETNPGVSSPEADIPKPELNLSGESSIIMDENKLSDGGESFIPLPGFEGECVDLVMLPLLPGVLRDLKDALADAETGKEDGKTLIIQEAAGRLAGKAEIFNLDKLGKLSRCVERAAEADDLEATAVLMQDLSNVTNRYLDSLQQCYENYMKMDR